MNIEQIQLSERGTLTALLHEKSNEMKNAAAERLAVILCPGGAYSFCSDRECDPPAIAFLNMGCQVFVLRYSVEPYAGNKRPLQEVAASVKIVRERADRWQVDKHKIVVCGFSAGGHLAASLGVHWNDPDIMRRCEVKDAQMLRPDAMILGYPVITAGIFAHRESIQRVSQDCHEDECYWSLETQVTEQTQPAFLWHTMNDPAVPIENSFLFAEQLHQAGVDCECHFFENGPHGMSIATEEVGTPSKRVHQWVSLCQSWLAEKFALDN